MKKVKRVAIYFYLCNNNKNNKNEVNNSKQDENNIVVNTTKRSDTWLIQTPQCFDRATLTRMHEKYKNDEVTDDCSLLEKDNYKIKVIPGGYTNLKITTSADMEILKMFFDKSHNF